MLHTGELGFDSLLRHFFKNSNQQTPWWSNHTAPPCYFHPNVAPALEKWWSVTVASAHGQTKRLDNQGGAKRGVVQQWVDKTTMNL